jgi:hypothetical protein
MAREHLEIGQLGRGHRERGEVVEVALRDAVEALLVRHLLHLRRQRLLGLPQALLVEFIPEVLAQLRLLARGVESLGKGP